MPTQSGGQASGEQSDGADQETMARMQMMEEQQRAALARQLAMQRQLNQQMQQAGGVPLLPTSFLSRGAA